MIMTPSAELKALELVSIVVTNAAVTAPSAPGNAVVHPYERFDGACIELNPSSNVADFVPAVQVELARHGVSSRVYGANFPETCRYSIHYVTQLEWGRHWFSPEYVAYMSAARIELREHGQVLAAASYKPSILGYDKWASTQEKIAPAVRVVAYGVAEVSASPAGSGRRKIVKN
ncbi:hypothetical protein Q9Q94_12515 [Uliginosibacterium sp. 31-16]|uniref:hypothetical protein n=1 Tax=Uliginosibacterium sp. 31-16 TaxID=3068315 RepID=UPI00273E3794|nr:hypothetical protein [Uliginosibacterium sp. 31-16]MDP5240358.1 hypothetical protein [Uliginosibacterium sp. 31-16]